MTQVKSNISVVILVFINFIFALKYLSRYTEYGFVISVMLTFIQILIYKYHAFHFFEKT